MKTKILLFLSTGMFLMQSCNKDDSSTLQNKEALVLETMFPNARNVQWEKKGVYHVADFKEKNMSVKAWFDQNAQWQMTETDISYQDLPATVKTAFESSDYATWRVEDVDKIERLNRETVYVIEIEKGNREVDLYYSSTGVLVKSVLDADKNDDYSDYVPQHLTTGITQIISQKYPNAKIVEVDRENGMMEVEIVDGNVRRDVYFDSSGKWLYTQTDVSISRLPLNVIKVVSASYSGYVIDDAEYMETPQGNYYLLELERGKMEIKVRVTPEGKIIR